ncbi:MAG: DNA-3-methyladenine glycosylase I [Acidimicrobiia bacterium]|nr:DNA-3-methyladenine glycosylase I [Acidimicrobiia bacterium]
MDVLVGDDGVARCWWADSPDIYRTYHDDEWGMPVDDDTLLFEKLCLEGFQAGLSWLTILERREGFRSAFRGFDIERVAAMRRADVDRLLGDAAIIRHRGKIESTLNNAKRTLEVIQELGSLGALVWAYEPDRPTSIRDATTPESTALAKDLKNRGFSFVGPTTVYAFMQAMGIVNDHLPECDARERVETARRGFLRPA